MSEELNSSDSDMMDADSTSETASASSRSKAPQASPQVIPAGPDNVVNLPSGQTIDSLDFDGRDLVIVLADGTRIVVPDGAIVIPQLNIDGTPIPPANVAALLVGNEPEPEAGVNPSSGGNFATDPGAIQSAYDLGDLLPYTELPQASLVEEEIIPDLIEDDEDPVVVIETPDNPVGVSNAIATVFEEGLPTRGQPSEPQGTNAAGDGETTSGRIVFSSPDGVSAILINGVAITAVGQSFTSPVGTLTITSINLATGEIGFSYTLQDNTLAQEFDGFFEVTVIDSDGDRASATLQIRVVDDAPIGVNDVGVDPVGNHDPIMGNVLDNDISGADDFPVNGGVTGFSNSSGNANPGGTLQGEYGVLTLNADGSYTYARDVNTPGGVEETFNYAIVDQDGSTSSAVLTIVIEDGPAKITFIPETGEGTVVNEAGLPVRNTEPAGTGEIADNDPANNSDPSETTTATVTFNSVDGLGSISINGIVIDLNNLPQTVISDATGTLVITAVTYDPLSGDGSLTYEYTLADNTSGDDTSVSFVITVTDLDGDSASDTLIITIVDDVPEARDDTGIAGADENAPITVDVFANDTAGADDVAFDKIAFVDGSLQGNGSVTYNGDGTFTYTPAPGEEGTITFDYTITDGDGDSSSATVTITLAADSVPTITVNGDSDVNEAGLPARTGEPEGSDAASDSEIAQGNIVITTGGDTLASLTVNGQDVTGGGTVVTAKGELTISVSNGVYSYSYTLTDNTLTDPDSDTFTLVVTDSDGDMANTSLVIAIVDDTPSAEDDAAGLAAGEYGPVGGSVLSNDTQGADGATVSSYSGTGGGGNTGDVVQGAYGTLTIAADGTFSYTRDPGTPGGVTDTFNYIITDGDGDPANANLVITIANSTTTLDLPTQGEEGTLVNEAGVESPFPGSAAAGDSEFTSGVFTFTAPDGPAIVTINGVEVTAVGQTFTGNFGTITIDSIAAGAIGYTYELTTNTSGDNTADSFAVVVTDQDGDFSNGTITIDIVDDVPTANADTNSVTEGASATGNVLTDVADVFGADGAQAAGGVVGVRAAGGDTTTDAAGNVGAVINGLYGTLTLNADGSYTYASTAGAITGDEIDVFVYTIADGDGDLSTTTLTINVANVTLAPDNDTQTVNEAALDTVGSDPASNAETATGQLAVTGAVSYALNSGSDTYGTLTLNPDGSYSYTLTSPFDTNPDADNGTNTQAGAESYSYTATDANGNTVTGTITIDIVDDVPTALAPIATTVINTAGSMSALTFLDADNDVDNNYGADGPGAVIFTSASVAALESQNLTSGFSGLNYTISPNGTVITATKQSDNTEVFKIELQPTGGADQYKVTIAQPLDSTSEIDFNGGNYNFTGGNNSWNGFVPNGESLGGTTIDNDSQDLLLTPEVNGMNGSSVNTTATIGGIGNTFVGSQSGGETFRVDFVTDLRGDTADTVGGQDYAAAANRDHNFDGHYTVNGATALFKSSSGSTVRITAFDDADGNTIVGDGVIDAINGVTIAFKGVAFGSVIIPTTTATNYTVNGQTFTVKLNGDGSVSVGGVAGNSGSSLLGTVIGVLTPSGYNSVEYSWEAGSTFQIGDFGATTITNDPVNFTVPISIRDGDGDIVDAGLLNITANPSVTPVVLDLNGGGNVFAPISSGIAYDYNGDGVKTQTAWVAAGSAILAFDYNGDGLVTDASEFVFGGNGLSDLEAVAASHDSNNDGVLDANDASYASFGVWLDSNLNAVSDEGEFVSLSDAGVTSINLISDGLGYVDADGDVFVSGTASFTMEDGSTGAVSDAAFATGVNVTEGGAMMEALLIMADNADDAPASVALLPHDNIAGDAVSDALAGKIIDNLIDQFASVAPEARADIAEATMSDFASLLSVEVGGHAMVFASSLSEVSMDEAGETAVIHG